MFAFKNKTKYSLERLLFGDPSNFKSVYIPFWSEEMFFWFSVPDLSDFI
jgi:hypothetical protein